VSETKDSRDDGPGLSAGDESVYDALFDAAEAALGPPPTRTDPAHDAYAALVGEWVGTVLKQRAAAGDAQAARIFMDSIARGIGRWLEEEETALGRPLWSATEAVERLYARAERNLGFPA
jgi:hypothetical protein